MDNCKVRMQKWLFKLKYVTETSVSKTIYHKSKNLKSKSASPLPTNQNLLSKELKRVYRATFDWMLAETVVGKEGSSRF